ncbi:MAG: hypothetical protein AAF741_04170 [Bacteroidota bacterium]
MNSIASKITLFSLPLIGIFPKLSGQIETSPKSDLADFYITISTNGNEFTLACERGCAWEQLTYELEDASRKALITTMGFMPFEELPEGEEFTEDYGFTMSRNGLYIELEALEGTAWKKTSFTLQDGEEQAINQLGMTE